MEKYAIYAEIFPCVHMVIHIMNLVANHADFFAVTSLLPIKRSFYIRFRWFNILYLTSPCYLSPLAKQSHDTSTEQDRDDHESQLAVVACAVRVEQEISGQQLNETSVDENTR